MRDSLNCPAVCDEKGKFIYFEVKWPGSVHNTRVYANSSINKKFTSKEYPPCYKKLLPGHTAVPPILLGNPVYPLLPNVMKECGNWTEAKHIIFNNKLRAARNQIKGAFGRLKAR